MKLETQPQEPIAGEPVYVTEDHAFSFNPKVSPHALEIVGDAGTTSLALGTLQLEVSIRTRRCLWLWGYSPQTGWARARVEAPPAEEGGVQVLDADLLSGVAIRAASDDAISRVFDRDSGWFALLTSSEPKGKAVLLATDTVVLVDAGKLAAVYVRPKNWRELDAK